MAAAEEREDAQQVKQRGDHGTGLSPDHSREINSLCAGQGFCEGQDRIVLGRLGGVADRGVHGPAIRVGDVVQVGEEHHVELAALAHARDVLVQLGPRPVVTRRRGARMPLHREVVVGRPMAAKLLRGASAFHRDVPTTLTSEAPAIALRAHSSDAAIPLTPPFRPRPMTGVRCAGVWRGSYSGCRDRGSPSPRAASMVEPGGSVARSLGLRALGLHAPAASRGFDHCHRHLDDAQAVDACRRRLAARRDRLLEVLDLRHVVRQ